MKNLVVIGNPPYNEKVEGRIASHSIYPLMTKTLMDHSQVSRLAFIIPAKWFCVKGILKKFREYIINSRRIRSITYFKDCKDVFKDVRFGGGVCFLDYDRDHKGKTTFINKDVSTQLDLTDCNFILDDTYAYKLIRKIRSIHKGIYLNETVISDNVFGIRNYYYKKSPEYFLDKESSQTAPCMFIKGEYKFILKKYIIRNQDKINDYKVMYNKSYSKGEFRTALQRRHFFIIPKGSVASHSYSCAGSFKTEPEALTFKKYLQTDFARYLLGVLKVTQNVGALTFSFIPDLKGEWTDDQLFKYFKFTNEDIMNIKNKLKEWS